MARLLEHEVARDAAHVFTRQAAVEAQGAEGLMLRKPGAPHRGGRISDLLKVKPKPKPEPKLKPNPNPNPNPNLLTS